MLLAAAAAAALTACGQGKESQEKETGSKTEEKSDDVLSVMTWDDNQAKGLQKILDDFTEETGIKAVSLPGHLPDSTPFPISSILQSAKHS